MHFLPSKTSFKVIFFSFVDYEEVQDEVRWPLVRRHPRSGRRGLYFGAKVTVGIDGMRGDIGFGAALTDENIGKLSIVGVGMRSHSGIAAKVFEVLAAAGVNIQMISTSEIKISVVIGIEKAEEATRAVHDAFLG